MMTNLNKLTCTSCGASLTEKENRAFCEFCGTKYAPPPPTEVRVELGQQFGAMAAHYERVDKQERKMEALKLKRDTIVNSAIYKRALSGATSVKEMEALKKAQQPYFSENEIGILHNTWLSAFKTAFVAWTLFIGGAAVFVALCVLYIVS